MVSVHGRRIPLVPTALVLALGVYVLVWAARDRTPATEVIEGSGTIEATQVHIAGRAPGRIREIRAAAGQAVRAGETLVVFEAQEVDAQVAQAEAALQGARALRANAVVTSPLDGVVLSRSAEPGEVVGAGVALLVVADLRTVWLRIYVPEALLGRLRVGQDAEVYVDAFPLRPFPARVVEIAGAAEFVPRNIATQQERAKLVFAVRLTLDNPQGLLKPGMPADARIRAPAPP